MCAYKSTSRKMCKLHFFIRLYKLTFSMYKEETLYMSQYKEITMIVQLYRNIYTIPASSYL